jgi:hypothetical protein
MRGAVVAWMAQACAFASLTGGSFALVWLVIASVVAVQALRSSASMDERATLWCVTMAVGTLVWSSVDGWPLIATLPMAVAFCVPLAWRSKVAI